MPPFAFTSLGVDSCSPQPSKRPFSSPLSVFFLHLLNFVPQRIALLGFPPQCLHLVTVSDLRRPLSAEAVGLKQTCFTILKSPAPAFRTSTVIQRAQSHVSSQYRGGGKGLFGGNIGPALPPPLGPGRLPLSIGLGPWNRGKGARGGPLGCG